MSITEKLRQEILAVTPSWNIGPPRLARRASPLDSEELPVVREETSFRPPSWVAASPSKQRDSLQDRTAVRAALTQSMRLSNISTRTGIPMSVAYRIVLNLLRGGEVVRTLGPDARYNYSLRT